MEQYATIRVKKSDIDILKMLKSMTKVKTLSEVVRNMAHKELSKVYAFTVDGYLPVGTKVIDTEDEVRVIEKVETRTALGPEVVFTDGSSAMNCGGYVWKLRKVASREEIMEEVQNGEY